MVVLIEDGMAMTGSNVIDRRCVNLVSRNALVECVLSVFMRCFSLI